VTTFNELAAIAPQRIWEGVTARPVHGDRVTLSLIELEANARVPEHSHENEQVGMVLSGSLRFRIGDETRDLERGATWCIPAHVPHDVTTGPDGAVLAEVFAPPRADWAAAPTEAPRPPLLGS
jgi:quercetin dioxygenase-like cupin family protein